MALPPPTQGQARLIWTALTALAVALLLALAVGALWGLGQIVQMLSSVLMPLGVAGVIACLLDPLVDRLQARLRIPRTRAILLTFFLAFMAVLILLATVVPHLVTEAKQLVNSIPNDSADLKERISEWLQTSPWGAKARAAWESDYASKFEGWMDGAVPAMAEWAGEHLLGLLKGAGAVLGLALVPIYVFYFLLEKQGITTNWKDYLPLTNSRARDEAIFVLGAINDCLVAFFRGQILVSMCTGALLAVGFLCLDLKYAVLLGALAAVLGIIPYLGYAICLVAALGVAAVQFHDWQHPLGVALVFAAAQAVEGLLISPKIMGDRTGLHPLVIIIAVLVGTTLLGGVLGGVLAIPLAAALRTVMFRYVWKRRQPAG